MAGTDAKLSALIDDAQLVDRFGESIPAFLYIYDLAERRNAYTNRALAEHLGYTPVELRAMGGELLARTIHPDDVARALAHHDQMRDAPDGAIGEVEYRVLSGSKGWRWLHSWETVLSRDDNGRPKHLLGVAQDVTDRVVMEEALRESEKRLAASEQRWRSIAENPFDFVVVIDRDYKFTYVNFPAPGLTQEDLIGKATPFDFIPAEEHAVMRAAYEEVFERGRAAAYEVYVPVVDKWLSSLVGPIREGDVVTHASILTREVTSERKRQEELARKNAELEEALETQRTLEAKLAQAAKLEAVGRLAGGIAHDFNNLLTGIGGVAELLSARLAPGDPMEADVADLQAAVQRGAGLTRQLLAFSRQRLVAPTIIDLNELLADATRMLSRLIGENIDLRLLPARAPVPVRCDRSQLDQVIVNLAVNARDAMPSGGSLVIELSEFDIDAAYCRQQPDAIPGRFGRLAVSDTGCGMDAATLSRIFEPFFTTKPVGMGTGLGLATVYGVVRQSGGFVHVYSEPGRGTTFRLYFPLAGAAPEAPRAAPAHPPRGTETILLVEDEVLVQKLARSALERFGYTVLTASRGDEALRLVEAGAVFDLLLTDVILPGLDGPDLFERAKAVKPALKVVFMSGYTDNLLEEKGLGAAKGRFLQKPFVPVELARLVRAVLDGETA